MPPHLRPKAKPTRGAADNGRGATRRLGAARFVRFDRRHALARRDVADAKQLAPIASWGALLSDSMVVSGATLFCQGIGVVTSLLFRALLTPAEMGIWQGLKLFLSYGNYLNLGVSKGAARELAIARGRGDESSAEEGIHAAFTANTFASLVLSAVLLAVSAWYYRYRGGWSSPWTGGLLAMAILVLLQRYETFLVTLQRARREFSLTSQLAIVEAVLTLAVGGFATWRWGVPGLYLSAGCVLVAAIAYLQFNAPIALHWRWNPSEMRRLTAIGLPMLLSGVLSSLFRSLDKLMILFFMADGAYELGCYSAALLVATQLYGVANQLAMVGAPRYAEAWGNTNNRTAVAELVVRNSLLMAWALAGAGLLAVAVATPLLTWFLPAYATGLPALAWLAPGVAAAGLALPLANYLATVDRQGRSLTVLAGATLCSALALRIVLSNGGGLPAVATTMSVASVIYLIALARTSIWVELEEEDRWRYAFHLTGAMAVLSVPAFVRWAAGDAFGADSGERFLTILGVAGGWGFFALCGWLWASRTTRSERSRAEADA